MRPLETLKQKLEVDKFLAPLICVGFARNGVGGLGGVDK